MVKEKYEKPEVKVVTLDEGLVVYASGETPHCSPNHPCSDCAECGDCAGVTG